MDILSLIPTFGGLIWTIVAFVLALSIIVAVHEYGHYIVARWTGIRSEVFSIGFGPVLWSRTDRHGTRWQIAALPFGGYVKFLGDTSAASDKPDAETMSRLSADERRQTMHGAPLWARAATVLAGPVFNFILSIVVFTGVVMWQGFTSEPLTVDRLQPLPAQELELEEGDAILAIGGEPAETLAELGTALDELEPSRYLDYTVLRDGSEEEVRGPWPYPPIVGGVTPQSAAMDARLRTGDVIVSVDGDPIFSFEQLREKVAASDGASLDLAVWRDGETLNITLSPRRMDLPLPEGGFETRWLIGVTGGLFFEPETQTPGFLEAVGTGVNQVLFIMESSISGLYHMAVGAISTCNLQGPVGIAETSGAAASQGITSFIWFIAVLSTAVGLLNLFPIPVLDGGHLVFHAYEAVTGRPPSDGALRVFMTVGLGLLLTLMAFALTNDLLLCP